MEARAATVGIAGLVGFPFGGGILDTVALTKTMIEPDPRDQAIRYLRTQKGDVGLPIFPTSYTPPFFPDTAEVQTVPWDVRVTQYRTQPNPPLAVPPDASESWIWDATIFDAGESLPDRIVVTSREALPVWRIQRKGVVPSMARAEMAKATRFFSLLYKNYRLEKTFGQMEFSKAIAADMVPQDICYTQPIIYVYRRERDAR